MKTPIQHLTHHLFHSKCLEAELKADIQRGEMQSMNCFSVFLQIIKGTKQPQARTLVSGPESPHLGKHFSRMTLTNKFSVLPWSHQCAADALSGWCRFWSSQSTEPYLQPITGFRAFGTTSNTSRMLTIKQRS
jgi:hypothetical protein